MNQTPPTTTTIQEHSLAELEELYTQAESIDSEIFSEMRSNLLLIHGEHYNRRRSQFYRRLRDTKDLSEQQKLRLTKNHIQKIVRAYTTNILADSPNVSFMPKHENELQCQKAAEMHDSIWQDAMERYGVDDLIDDWCDDYVGVGEVSVKTFWDPMAGELKGHYQQTNEDGEPLFDPETGEPVRGEAVYTGAFVFETIQGFNLLRAPEAKDMRMSPYLIYRKMVQTEVLKAAHPDLGNQIVPSADGTMMVFDTAQQGYRAAQNETLLREIYFRPCPRYPNGYFYFYTREQITDKGELPGGIFPINSRPYHRVQTSARGRGPVKIMRPYQAEINRAASKIAEHQVTLGDDKILTQDGTTISQGVALPGVRSVNYQGMKPEILPGRNGAQYLDYMQAQITELYNVMDLKEEMEEANTGQMDPYAMLFKAASKKRKFKRNIKGFERFLIDVAKTYIRLAKIHLPEDMLIQAVGKMEQVNIAEFKRAPDLNYVIKAVPQSDDVESKFGQQLAINHALQYVSNKLEKEDIGKLMRAMPYGNFEESFSDLTLDYDLGTNMILALDRGEPVQPDAYDNHEYLIKRLTSRLRMPDFKFLAPPIQMAYRSMIQQYQQLEAQRQQAIQAANAGFIPTDGYMVKCDFYVADPANPEKTRRAEIPYEAMKWLIQHLANQGQDLDELAKMNQGNLAEISQMMMQGGAPVMQKPQVGPPRGAIPTTSRPIGPGAPQPAPSGAPMGPGAPRPQLPPGRPGMPPRPSMPMPPQPNMGGAPAMAPRSM